MADQRVPLPPLVVPVPQDSTLGAGRDAVTGRTIPADRLIYVDGKPRDARFPTRIDEPGYPLDALLTQVKPFGGEG